MQRTIALLLALVLMLALATTVFAHPGPTDSKGGHYDQKLGYHYHKSR